MEDWGNVYLFFIFILFYLYCIIVHDLVWFVFCRIKELFDIIVDFPDSKLALTDLRECLNHVDMREELMESLTKVYVLIHYTSPSLSLPFSFLPPSLH